MATTLPVTFRGAPLQSNLKYTPQQFFDAIVARLSIESQDELSFFTTGSVAPTSNTGPWLKNGITWYVWDVNTGSYIPQVIEQESLKYWVGSTTPDQAKYQFWIKLDGAGKAQGLFTYYSGAWHDAYEDIFANYSTTAQMNAAIEAAGVTERNRLPAGAYMGGSQSVPIDTIYHKLEMNTESYDPGENYDPAQARYVAEFTGLYRASAYVQIDNDTGVAASMECSLKLAKNSNPSLPFGIDGDATPNPTGQRWYMNFSTAIPLNAGDYLEVFVSFNDGTNTGLVNCGNGYFNIELVQRIA